MNVGVDRMHGCSKCVEALSVNGAGHIGAVGKSVSEFPVTIKFISYFPKFNAVPLYLICPLYPFGCNLWSPRAYVDSNHRFGTQILDPFVLCFNV